MRFRQSATIILPQYYLIAAQARPGHIARDKLYNNNGGKAYFNI